MIDLSDMAMKFHSFLLAQHWGGDDFMKQYSIKIQCIAEYYYTPFQNKK